MEVSAVYCCVGIVAIFVLFAGKLLDKFWIQPKKKEKFLRNQGLNGTCYKFVVGDFKEMTQMTSEAESKPMSLTHDIAPRVFPLIYKSVNTYGKNCFTWMGPIPMIHVSEPAMIREILGNHNKFQKTKTINPLSKMLVSGLIDLDGDQWVKHRKIINPAFHAEKLKHMLPAFYLSCNELIKKWGEMTGENGVGEVDVWPGLQMFTRDALSRTAFGSSFKEGGKIFDLQSEQAKLVAKAANSMFIPGYSFFPTKIKKRMQEIEREVKGSIRRIIDKRVASMNDSDSSNDDFLGILLDSNQKEIKERKSNDFGLNIEEVIDEIKFSTLQGKKPPQTCLCGP